MSAVSEPLMTVSGLSSGYGPVTILREIDISVAPGSVTALVGANGAGKTTLMKAIAGLLPAWSGTIRFDGKDITRVPTHERVGQGIVLVPEGRMVFALLSVEQNLRLGAITHGRGTISVTGWRRCLSVFLACRSGGGSWPAACPVASSRCWRSAAD